MKKPDVNFYPVVDFFEVERYLSDLYEEPMDILIPLFGDCVSNDIYMEYSIEEPEEKYIEVEWETEEYWNMRNRFEKYLWEEFSGFEKVIVRISW